VLQNVALAAAVGALSLVVHLRGIVEDRGWVATVPGCLDDLLDAAGALKVGSSNLLVHVVHICAVVLA
jgi:hypothetical protein